MRNWANDTNGHSSKRRWLSNTGKDGCFTSAKINVNIMTPLLPNGCSKVKKFKISTSDKV